MQLRLDGKVAWITGGSEGIGRGIALLAAKCGAKVAITGRDEQTLQHVVAEIEQAGGQAIYTCADVSQSEEVERSVQAIMERWHQLDFVCANAGTNGTWAPIEQLAPDDWSDTIAVNLTGTYLTIHHSVPHLTAGASIVIMSSVNGTRMFSNSGASAYAASKAGQLALGQMLALELAPRKIRVNVICPGAIDSKIHEKTEREDLESIQTPIDYPHGGIPLTGGAMGTPEQVAQLAIFLASDWAALITGTPVWIDGGQSLLQG